jgi:hypothetical protein
LFIRGIKFYGANCKIPLETKIGRANGYYRLSSLEFIQALILQHHLLELLVDGYNIGNHESHLANFLRVD